MSRPDTMLYDWFDCAAILECVNSHVAMSAYRLFGNMIKRCLEQWCDAKDTGFRSINLNRFERTFAA